MAKSRQKAALAAPVVSKPAARLPTNITTHIWYHLFRSSIFQLEQKPVLQSQYHVHAEEFKIVGDITVGLK